jgi:MHS family proline/betaine transporter-like MFS transporter
MQSQSTRRAVIAAALGNAFEWYDFSVYAAFAIYLGKAFFPSGDAAGDLVKAFLAFGLGFLVRPIGAVLLGALADAAGRKAALSLTIGLMLAGTAVIAFAPTYAAIGVGAPLLILVGRSLQGFSAGGEVGGATAFLVETAPPGRRGEFAAWLQASMALSNIMAALVAFGVTGALAPEAVQAWGWRLPFLFGLLIGPAGWWLRSTLDETPAFEAEIRSAAPRRPLAALLEGGGLGGLLRGAGLSVLWTVSTYVLVVFMPVYAQRTFGYAPRQAFGCALAGSLMLAAASLGGGILSDRVGRRAMLLGAGSVLAVLPYPMLAWMQRAPTTGALLASLSLFGLFAGLFVGVAPAALAEQFPARTRSLGVSVSYNLAVTVFSGFAPAALIWISTHGGGVFAPAWYLSLAAALALPAILSLA